jgi:hypothetical protein
MEITKIHTFGVHLRAIGLAVFLSVLGTHLARADHEGNWKQFCKNPVMGSYTFGANCRDDKGNYKWSTLDLMRCVGRPKLDLSQKVGGSGKAVVVNVQNGTLVCG